MSAVPQEGHLICNAMEEVGNREFIQVTFQGEPVTKLSWIRICSGNSYNSHRKVSGR